MSPLRCLVLCSTVLVFHASALAQSENVPLTRAQVLQHLSDLEGVGYRPSQASSLRYPYDIEAAEERLAEKKREQNAPIQPSPDIRSATRAGSPAAITPDGNP